MNNNNFGIKWIEMEKCLNLQSISEFIKHGGDISAVDKRTFSERLTKADSDLLEYLGGVCEKDKTEDILEKIAVYSNIQQDVHFAIGMKVGAQLIIQLTSNLESDF